MHPREREIRGLSSMSVDGVGIPDDEEVLKNTLVKSCNWDNESFELFSMINKISLQHAELLDSYKKLCELFVEYYTKYPPRS